MSIIDKLLELEANIKYRIITKQYPETNEIFGINNRALPLKESIENYDTVKYILANYGIFCKIVEDIYKDYINEIAVFINELKYDPSAEEIMYIFCYLLFNGYLSQNNEFKFLFPEKELDVRMGISVIYGQGVCRNVGILLTDILREFELESYGIITDRTTHSSTKIILYEGFYNLTMRCNNEFERQCEEHYRNREPITGDHFEVLVKDKKWKLLDPSNAGYYRIVKKKNDYSLLNYLKFWSLYAFGTCNMRQVTQLYNLLKDKYLLIDNSKENMDKQKECYSICEENKTKILKFHEQQYKRIELLSKSIEDLKK